MWEERQGMTCDFIGCFKVFMYSGHLIRLDVPFVWTSLLDNIMVESLILILIIGLK